MDCFVALLLAKTKDLRFSQVGFAKLSFRAATGTPGIRFYQRWFGHNGFRIVASLVGETEELLVIKCFSLYV
jgi:hypothetical protein